MLSDLRKTDDFYRWHTLSVGLTSCCNLRCKMCPVIRREKLSLTREQALHIADFARRREFRRIVVGGGEPTIMAYFWEFMETLAETDIEIWLLTNAVGLKDPDIERLSRFKRLVVNISIDGVGPVHDAIRGEGTFAASTAAMEKLLSAGCSVAVNTVVQKTNFDRMVETYEYFKKYPLAWHGFGYAETGHGQELVPAGNMEDSFSELREICRRCTAEGKGEVLSREMIRGFVLQYHYPSLAMHPGYQCTIPQRLLAIDETGWVLPCWHFLGWAKKDYRNINHRTLDEIVDSDEVRDEIRAAIGPKGCRGCSTMCYFWDNDFRQKTMHPKGKLRVRRAALHTKEYARLRFPVLFSAARNMWRGIKGQS